MKPQQMASVAFTFLGVLALLSSITLFQAIVTLPYFPDDLEGKPSLIFFAYVFPFAILLAAGVLLITRRLQLAAWAFRGEETEEPHERWDDLPDLLFALLGVYLVVSTLPSLGSLAGQLINLRAWPGIDEQSWALWSSLGHYLGTLAEFVIGAYLFINARGIGRWWKNRDRRSAAAREIEAALPSCPRCGTDFKPSDYQNDLSEKLCSQCKTKLPDSLFDQ